MKFKKEDLQDLAYEDAPEGFECIENNIIGTSRWSIQYTMVFKHDGKFYRSHFSMGATEMQYESPYEYEPDEIECQEVHPVEKMVTVYE